MTQEPAPDSYLLRWKGDELAVTLRLGARRAGRAVFRTDLGGAWHDVPMSETAPGTFACTVPLDAVGIFSGKACFFPKGKDQPEWPHGGNLRVKVAPAATRRANSIYTVFPRQFGGARFLNPEDEPGVREAQDFLDAKGYSVIPPSGTFRDVARELGHIMDDMGFRIVQLLPIFPVPATFARMGRYGCPFAATDFLSVDPACAEFDPHATPLDQFRELADAVHAKVPRAGRRGPREGRRPLRGPACQPHRLGGHSPDPPSRLVQACRRRGVRLAGSVGRDMGGSCGARLLKFRAPRLHGRRVPLLVPSGR